MSNSMDWKLKWYNYVFSLKELSDQREKGSQKLRFGRSVIVASDIARQYYCEKKVELAYLHGEVETEAKMIGSAAHENLLEDAAEIKKEDLWKQIHGKQPTLALEMFILSKYQDVFIAGKPDSVLFHKGSPIILFEFKFSQNTTSYATHHVQAKTYGMILENMGFDTSRLFYAIVIADPKTKNVPELQNKALDTIMQHGFKDAILTIENATIHLHRYNRTEAENDIGWAIQYWKNNREALPTNNPNKCLRCEYKPQCQLGFFSD